MNLEAIAAAKRWQSMLDYYGSIDKPFEPDLSALLADLHHYCAMHKVSLSDALRDGHLIYNQEMIDYYTTYGD